MRVVFAGTPTFAVFPLEALAAAGHEIVLVLTRPDKPAGRSMALAMSPVKIVATRLGLAVYQPPTLRESVVQEHLKSAAPDVIVVVAYGLILPQVVLDIPRFGAINIHASLLPRWRGAAPIHRAIAAGDTQTGISIMQMDAGLDTGPLLVAHALPIAPSETTGTLHDKLSTMGADAIVEVLNGIAERRLVLIPQHHEGVTYAAKVTKRETWLDWSRPAIELERCIRAFNPTPGAQARFADIELKVWKGSALGNVTDQHRSPGTVLQVDSAGVDVACGEGMLRLEVVQRAGGRQMAVADLLRGFAMKPGDRFTSSASPE
ncbi:MAG: methionyl-tRNA formyltransferase [Burkholderiales bacterium]